MAKDKSNPYFTYDPSKCIVCSRCVRACEEVQGTLRADHRGPRLRHACLPGMHEDFMVECVSCGACVQACPTATLTEKSVIGSASPNIRSSPPAPIAASAAPSRPRCAATNWCAWCRGRTAGQPRPFLRQRPLRLRLRDATRSASSTRWSAKDHRPVARGLLEEAFAHMASEFRRIQYQYGRTRSAASPRRAAPTKRPISSRS